MILILGDGLLGSEIQKQTGWNYISRKKDGFDITDTANWVDLISKETKVIVNLIANTDTYSDDYLKMIDVNYRGVKDLVSFCNLQKIKLIHYSTDYVYVNSDSNASETTIAKPHNMYGISKLLADEYVLGMAKKPLVLRGSQKIEPFPFSKAFDDVIGNFDYVSVMAEITIQMIKANASGLYNIGTPVKSMYELAKQTNPDVIPGKAPDHFPKDVTMDLTKMNNFLNYGKKTT